MLRPHHRVHRELELGGLALEQFDDRAEFVVGEAQLAMERTRSRHRPSYRTRHRLSRAGQCGEREGDGRVGVEHASFVVPHVELVAQRDPRLREVVVEALVLERLPGGRAHAGAQRRRGAGEPRTRLRVTARDREPGQRLERRREIRPVAPGQLPGERGAVRAIGSCEIVLGPREEPRQVP